MTTPRGHFFRVDAASNLDHPHASRRTETVEAFWRYYMELVANPGPFDPAATRKRLEGFATGEDLETLLDFIHGNSLVHDARPPTSTAIP